MDKVCSKSSHKWLLSLAASLLTVVCISAEAGKLFKWVDDQGQTRYGDRIPPQYAKDRQETLNDQGIVIQTRAAEKTKEQLAEEKRLADIAAEEKRVQEASDARDRALLDTFTSEDDMIMTRDGKIEAIDAAVRLTRARTTKTQERLANITLHAANLERRGAAIPEHLHKEIVDARSQIEYNDRYVENKLNEQQRVRDKFEADFKRFRELKMDMNDTDDHIISRESASQYPRQ